MSFVVEVDRRFPVRPGLASPVRAGNGQPLLEPGATVDLTVTAGVAFEDEQLDPLGRYLDTDAVADLVDAACAGLTTRVWTELFDFRPTFELVARHLFERLREGVPQLAFVELRDETFGSRTRYRTGSISRVSGPGWPYR